MFVLQMRRRSIHFVGAQKCVDRGREINLTAAVNKDTLTRGLRYSIATGNWGMQGTAGLSTLR